MLLLLSSVFAQNVTDAAVPVMNAQLFRPSIDSKSTLWTDQTLAAGDRYTMARAIVHYANDPLVYVAKNGDRTELVSGIWQLNLSAAHTRGKLRLGADLPVYLRTNGSLGGETGLGDIGLEARYSLLDRRTAFFGVAPIVRVNLPTTTVDAPLGNGSFGYEVGLAADKELGSSTVFAVNIGTRGIPEVALENVEWGDQLFLRAGIGHELTEDAGLSVDFARFMTYGQFSNPAANPSEVLLGGWKRLDSGLTLRAGVGTAVNGGVGAAKYRVVFGLGYEPATEGDSDMDGILDGKDACPQDPEDFDGYMDEDGCPEATPVTVVLINKRDEQVTGGTWTLGDATGATGDQLELEAGKYSVTASHEDYKPAALDATVPDGGPHTVTVNMDLIPGTLLVKAVDNEGNIVADATWRAADTNISDIAAGSSYELDHGDYVIVVTASGYRPVKEKVTVEKDSEAVVQLEMVPSKAKVTKERIVIEEKVFFEVDKDIIKPESYGLLDDVAGIMVAHPELTLVRVEGHTDSDGSDDSNMDLSQRRAQAVTDYLVGKGVEPGRLKAVGYGESKPLGTNKAKNRRVELHVAERSDGPPPAIKKSPRTEDMEKKKKTE
jgi:outer membrane protein OmpA-like peptidoglycan-associated protein